MTTILIALTLLTTGLAGCTGDPDGGGNDEIDSETLQGMIEAGLQDFMNNTSVEISANYYTNSTNQYNVNGSSVVGSSLHTMSGTTQGEGVSNFQGVVTANFTQQDYHAVLIPESILSSSSVSNTESSMYLMQQLSNSVGSVCVDIGSETESALSEMSGSLGIFGTGWHYNVVNSEPLNSSMNYTGIQSLLSGECYAIADTLSNLNQIRTTLEGQSNDQYWIMPIIAEHNLEFISNTKSGFEVVIEQQEGVLTNILGYYVAVSITGTCVTANCTSGNVSESFVFRHFHSGIFNQFGYYFPPPYAVESDFTASSECAGGISSVSESMTGLRLGAGLECTHALSFEAELMAYFSANHFEDDYSFEWSDWTYYVLWEEIPVTVHE